MGVKGGHWIGQGVGRINEHPQHFEGNSRHCAVEYQVTMKLKVRKHQAGEGGQVEWRGPKFVTWEFCAALKPSTNRHPRLCHGPYSKA